MKLRDASLDIFKGSPTCMNTLDISFQSSHPPALPIPAAVQGWGRWHIGNVTYFNSVQCQPEIDLLCKHLKPFNTPYAFPNTLVIMFP